MGYLLFLDIIYLFLFKGLLIFTLMALWILKAFYINSKVLTKLGLLGILSSLTNCN